MDRKIDFLDRVATALMGVVAGILYGFFLAVCVLAVTDEWHGPLVAWSAGVFGVIGFLFENVLYEGILVLMHFLYGLLIADSTYELPSREFGQSNGLYLSMFIGIGTGVIFGGYWWV